MPPSSDEPEDLTLAIHSEIRAMRSEMREAFADISASLDRVETKLGEVIAIIENSK